MLRLDLDGFTAAEVYRYVLEGLEREHARVLGAIAELRGQLDGAVKPAPRTEKAPKAPKTPKTGRLSKEGRERIAAAQRRRWAAKKQVPRKGRVKPEPEAPVEAAQAAVD